MIFHVKDVLAGRRRPDPDQLLLELRKSWIIWIADADSERPDAGVSQLLGRFDRRLEVRLAVRDNDDDVPDVEPVAGPLPVDLSAGQPQGGRRVRTRALVVLDVNDGVENGLRGEVTL